MINVLLAVISALLWGGAYGAYFAPELRRLGRRLRHGPPPPVRRPRRVAPARTRPAPPRSYVGAPLPTFPALPPPAARPAPPPRPSNVIPFPKRPRG